LTQSGLVLQACILHAGVLQACDLPELVSHG
jgi:hypothetical protein